MPNKNVVASGITTDKRSLKQKIAAQLALVCSKTMAYAERYNNAELSAQTNTGENLIFRMKDAALPAYAQSVNNLVAPLLNNADYTEYGITQAVLDALLADAQRLNSMIGAADVMASNGTVPNTAINKTLTKLRSNIKQLKRLIAEFATSNPDFVQGFQINSAIDKAGTRHSGIEGTVTNKAGGTVSGATVQLEGTAKTAVTDLNGYYRIDRVATNDYNVVCSAPGYTTQTVMHHISRGKVDALNFVL